MSDITEQLKRATEILSENGVAQPRREAASLLALALRKDKTFIVAHSEYELTSDEETRFLEFTRRRARREPFQYIAARQEFFGLEFLVTNDVLIPRPETELLVETAIEILRETNAPAFCEVGVGSGCISISILHALQKARGVGFDISAAALEIAAQNAARHSVADRLKLEVSNVFENLNVRESLPDDESLPTKFDLIVSNPPYISIDDLNDLQREVRDFEPRFALTDGENGLTIIEKIIAGAPRFLKADSHLLLEIGFGQAEKVRAMFAPLVWEKVEILPDLQGIPRTVKAKIAGD